MLWKMFKWANPNVYISSIIVIKSLDLGLHAGPNLIFLFLIIFIIIWQLCFKIELRGPRTNPIMHGVTLCLPMRLWALLLHGFLFDGVQGLFIMKTCQ